MLHAVIMAGGAGTRFWPASRVALPKQLLDLAGERTMIQATVDRLGEMVPPERLLVVTNRQLVDPMAEQLPQVPRAALIGEPCKRDTAPCVGLAALLVSHADPDATMVVMPADHVISPEEEFSRGDCQCRGDGERGTRSGSSRFGIKPTFPAESYGYIERGRETGRHVRLSRGEVSREAEGRRRRGVSGDRQLLLERRHFRLEGQDDSRCAGGIRTGHVRTTGRHWRQSSARPRFAETFASRFEAIRGKSIDYAVLERYADVAVLEANFDWDDVGNWQSLARLRGVDAAGNTIVGKHLGIETSGTIVRTDEQHLVVTVGLEDCIVVHTPGATLVASKRSEEAVRKVAEMLRERGWNDYL